MAARITAFLVAAIVGVTLVAGLIVGAQRDDDSGPIDLLVYNARIFTGQQDEPFAEALAVRGNRIYRVGSNREIKRLRRRATTVIDAHGGSVLPGFADSYASLPEATVPAAAEAEPGSEPGVPATPAAPARRAIEEAIAGAHRLGLTSLVAVMAEPATLELFDRVRQDSTRPIRIAAALEVTPPLDGAAIEGLAKLRTRYGTNPLLRLDAIAMDVQLAAAPSQNDRALRRPDLPLLPDAQAQAILALDRAGWPVVLRVDDEREMAAALDVMARVVESNPAPAEGRRHRLALARPLPLDTARLTALNVGISVPLAGSWPSPAPLAGGKPGAPAAIDGPLPFAFPLPEEVKLLMASEPLADPRLGLQALVAAGSTLEDEEAPVEHDLLVRALDTLTLEPARAVGDDDERGTLAPGRLADFVILSADLFDLPATRLLDAVVTTTVVDGKVVYDREAETVQTEQD